MNTAVNVKQLDKPTINKNNVNSLLHKNGFSPKKNDTRKIKAFGSEEEMLSYIDDIGAYIYGD